MIVVFKNLVSSLDVIIQQPNIDKKCKLEVIPQQ